MPADYGIGQKLRESPVTLSGGCEGEETMSCDERPRVPPNTGDQILNEADVLRITGIGRTTRWKLEKEGRFPTRVRLSDGRVGWRRSEVEQWIADCEPVLPVSSSH